MEDTLRKAYKEYLQPEEYDKYYNNIYLYVRYLIKECATDYRICEDKTLDLNIKRCILLSLIQQCQDELTQPIQTHDFTELMDEFHKIFKKHAVEYDGTYSRIRYVTEVIPIFCLMVIMIDQIIKYNPDIDTSF